MANPTLPSTTTNTPPLFDATVQRSPAEAQEAQAAWQTWLGCNPEEQNTAGMTFVLIPPGEFVMRCIEGDHASSLGKATKLHVRLTQPLLVSKTVVTQAQWTAIMRTTPWSNSPRQKRGSTYPATNISWNDAVAFCKKISEEEGRTYRLLSEAEWEYSCRAGTTTKYNFGDDESLLDKYAWFDQNTSKLGQRYAHPVALKQPNAFGLYDMHGNVWEWCQDWYDEKYYFNSKPLMLDPTGPPIGEWRVYRGGGYDDTAWNCRSGYRIRCAPGYRHSFLSFRVAQILSETTPSCRASTA